MEIEDLEMRVRKRIFDELHSQVLPQLKGLGVWYKAIARDQSMDIDSVRQEFEKIEEELTHNIQKIRTIVLPQIYNSELLSELPIGKARFLNDLEKEMQRLRNKLGIDLHFSYLLDEIKRLTPMHFLPIQDILFNWLDNIASYACAKQITVELRTNETISPTFFILKVTDNGKGDSSLNDLDSFCNQLSSEHRGLRIIKQSAELLGATLKIDSSIEGTVLLVSDIPILTNLGY